jgi:hypothetical protein
LDIELFQVSRPVMPGEVLMPADVRNTVVEKEPEETPTVECRLAKIVRAACDGCGRIVGPGQLHLPEEDYGFWCEDCCPVCSPLASIKINSRAA